MKSILFISAMNGAAWGGSEEQWYQAALYFRSQAVKVGICVFYWKEKEHKLQILKNAGCEIYLLTHRGSGVLAALKNKRQLYAIPFQEYEFAYINQGGWHDVTHGAFKNLYKRLPAYALSFHNYQFQTHIKKSRQRLLNNWVLASRIAIVASTQIFKMLEEEYQIFAPVKSVYYCPITLDYIQIANKEKKPSRLPEVVFLTLGSLEVGRKSQDILIKAFAQEQWKHRKWRLHIYGSGKDHDLLQALISSLSLEQHVYLMGHTDAVEKVIHDSDMLIQVTKIDAMPITVMEAMAMGVPCMVSPVGDMPLWVQPGYNGFITTAVTESALADELESAWASRESWATLGKNARLTFLEKYPHPYQEKFAAMLMEIAK